LHNPKEEINSNSSLVVIEKIIYQYIEINNDVGISYLRGSARGIHAACIFNIGPLGGICTLFIFILETFF